MQFFLYNPLSKNNQAKEKINFDNLPNSYDSTNSKDIIKLRKKLKKNDTVALIGGDGTLHYLINNYSFLLNNKIDYYKNGSGNDFNEALQKHKYSYYYTINNDKKFINSFGIGFDALICFKVNQLENKSKLSYIKEAYKSLKEYKPMDIEVKYHDKVHKIQKVWLCSLQNGPYFGGGIKIAKNAKITDKELELCIAHNLNRFQVLLLLLFVQLGLVHLFSKYFYTVKVNDFKLYNKKNIIAQLDGDVVEYDNDISITSCDILKIKKGKHSIK